MSTSAVLQKMNYLQEPEDYSGKSRMLLVVFTCTKFYYLLHVKTYHILKKKQHFYHCTSQLLLSDITLPEKPKLRTMTKVPQLLPNHKHLKMKKSLHLIRGPEQVHTALLHEQFGIRVRMSPLNVQYL